MMTGRVDDEGHAVLTLVITNPVTGASVHLDTWVDTGFTGGLLLPPVVIASLGLQRSSAVSAELADGHARGFPYAHLFGRLVRPATADRVAGGRRSRSAIGRGPDQRMHPHC